MAFEPKRAEKTRETNGTKEGRAATEALAREASESQAAATETAKAASELVISTAKQQAESGADLVEHVAADTAHAHAAAAEKSVEIGKSALDAAASTATKAAASAEQTAHEAGETAQKAAQAGAESVQQGMRAAVAGWQKQFAGFGTGQQFLGTTARVIEIYRDASEGTSANARALANTYVHLGRGMQGLQKTYIQLLERATQRAAHRPMDLLRCKSFEEFARVQRDMYVDALNYSLEATGTMLEAAGTVAQDALKSLEEERTQAKS